MTRMLSKAVGAFIILGLLSPNMALADPTTVAVAPVAPVASTATATDVAQAGPLSDVPLNSWAYDAVDQLAKDGIIKGYPDGTFKGNRPMTRYEAAVLAYRAVDMIEAQITAGKAVEKADIDAANKLIAAFGAELKTVERHVDALQKEADDTKAESAATKNGLGATNKRVDGQAGQIGALNDFAKGAHIKFQGMYISGAYNQSIQANCPTTPLFGGSPGGTIPAATSNQAFCSANAARAGQTLLTGAAPGAYQPQGAGVPPSSALAAGARSSGVAFYYYKFSVTGQPAPNTSYLFELGTNVRQAQAGGTTTDTTAFCTPLNTPAGVATCTSPTLAGAAQFTNGGSGALVSVNNAWFQLNNPNSGAFLRMGHLQNNLSPAQDGFLGGNYFYGAMLGIQHGPFFAYIGYGFGDNGASNFALNAVPFAEQEVVANVEYQLYLGKLGVNLGGWYDDSTGFNQTTWDAGAVMCTGAAGTTFFANTAASPFTTCGAGRATPTYGNGNPVTGYYLSPVLNATAPITGLATGNASAVLGGHVVLTDGKLRAQFAGSMRTGNDPYTNKPWLGNLAGDVQLDYGPTRPGKGNRGQWTYEAQAFALGFNAQNQSSNLVGGPVLYNSFTTNWGGTYWAEAGVKYWLNDFTYASLAYGHTGLMPNTLLPIGSTCIGCVVSGLNQNMLFAQVNMNF